MSRRYEKHYARHSTAFWPKTNTQSDSKPDPAEQAAKLIEQAERAAYKQRINESVADRIALIKKSDDLDEYLTALRKALQDLVVRQSEKSAKNKYVEQVSAYRTECSARDLLLTQIETNRKLIENVKQQAAARGTAQAITDAIVRDLQNTIRALECNIPEPQIAPTEPDFKTIHSEHQIDLKYKAALVDLIKSTENAIEDRKIQAEKSKWLDVYRQYAKRKGVHFEETRMIFRACRDYHRHHYANDISLEDLEDAGIDINDPGFISYRYKYKYHFGCCKNWASECGKYSHRPHWLIRRSRKTRYRPESHRLYHDSDSDEEPDRFRDPYSDEEEDEDVFSFRWNEDDGTDDDSDCKPTKPAESKLSKPSEPSEPDSPAEDEDTILQRMVANAKLKQ